MVKSFTHNPTKFQVKEFPSFRNPHILVQNCFWEKYPFLHENLIKLIHRRFLNWPVVLLHDLTNNVLK